MGLFVCAVLFVCLFSVGFSSCCFCLFVRIFVVVFVLLLFFVATFMNDGGLAASEEGKTNVSKAICHFPSRR